MRCWGSRGLRPLGYAGHVSLASGYDGARLACRPVASEAGEGWWSQAGSNRRPLACHASALPAELWPRRVKARSSPTCSRKLGAGLAGETQNTVQGRSQVSSSPPTSPMMSVTSSSPSSSSGMKVESSSSSPSMVSSISMSSSEFGNHGLDLAGVLLGVGLLKQDQLFGLGRLGLIGSGGC